MVRDTEDKENYANLPEGKVLTAQGANPESYELVRRIARGRTAVIWIAKQVNAGRHVCLKIYRSGEDHFRTAYAQMALNEVSLLSKIHRQDPAGKKPVVRLVDYFSFVNKPSGKHQVVVMNLAGASVSHLVDNYYPEAVNLPIAKHIARQLLEAVAFLHDECGIIHGDIKTEDLLVVRNEMTRRFEPEPRSLPQPVKLGPDHSAPAQQGDLAQVSTAGLSKNQKKRLKEKLKKQAAAAAAKGEAPPTPAAAPAAEEKTKTDEGKGKARAEENVDLYCPPADSADLSTPGSSQAALESTFRVTLGDFGHAFWVNKFVHDYDFFGRPNRAPEQLICAPVMQAADMWGVGCTIFELFTGEFLFDLPPHEEVPDPARRDEGHLAEMMALTGQEMPMDVLSVGEKTHFLFKPNQNRLKHIAPSKIKHWPMKAVLMDKYEWNEKDAAEFADFLSHMIVLDPRLRCTAASVLEKFQDYLTPDVQALKEVDFEWETPEFLHRPLPEKLAQLREEEEGKRRGDNQAQRELAEAVEDGLLFASRFQPIFRVGAGAFSVVYFGEDTMSHACVAIKVEVKLFHEESLLLNEARVYQTMSQYPGFPKFFWAGRHDNYVATVMEFLGGDLHRRKFSVPVALKLAIQLTEALEALHNEGYLHNDLKPGNIVLRNQDSVCLVDLGLAEKWQDGEGKHIEWKTGLKMLGNPKFASINNHRGNALSRRDDLEAMAYCFMEFLRGDTPWHGVSRNSLGKTRVEQFQPLCDVKANTPEEAMFKGYPKCFAEYLRQVKALGFEDTPDYKGLVQLFKDCLREDYSTEDHSEITYMAKFALPPELHRKLQNSPTAEAAIREYPVDIAIDFQPREDGQVLQLHQKEYKDSGKDRGGKGGKGNKGKEKGQGAQRGRQL